MLTIYNILYNNPTSFSGPYSYDCLSVNFCGDSIVMFTKLERPYHLTCFPMSVDHHHVCEIFLFADTVPTEVSYKHWPIREHYFEHVIMLTGCLCPPCVL